LLIEKLGKDKTKHLKEKIYILKNNIQDEPVCKTCRNPVQYSLRKERYLKYCSSECSNSCSEVREKKRKTYIKKYGVDNPQKNKQIQEKSKQTCMQKYGVENPLMLLKNEVSKSYKERYGKERSQQIMEKRKQTCMEKYGVEHGTQSEQAKEKRQVTNRKKYGGNAPACDDQIKQKIQQTNLQKYGTPSPIQNKQIQEKNKLPYEQRYGENCEKVKQNRKKAFLEKFGVENPFASDEIKQKIKQTLLEKYGVENISRTDYVKNIHKKRYYEKLFSLNQIKPNFKMQDYGGDKYKIYSWICNKTGKTFEAWYANGLIPLCPCCHPKEGTNIENHIISFLKKHKIDYQFRNRSILGDGSELDFYIPIKNVAIEVHGLYWHTERKIMERGKNPRLYHLSKLENSEKNNIRLIQIFSDEILNHPRIVENRLKTILGIKKRTIGARECVVKIMDTKTKSIFLEKYHIQGDDRSSICLGLFYKNRLVSVMTFAKPRLVMGHKNPPSGSYELLRFCSNFHFSVVGGAGKLLNFFKKNYEWTSIITYADRRWSVGNLYKKLGFNFSHNSSPNYFYTKNYNFREYRYKYNKSVLVKKFPELKEYSERIIMDSLGYERIYDCGHASFNLINSKNV
jgi:G:T-mismatch repair DNA endonuclease (very short patch repair protein)